MDEYLFTLDNESGSVWNPHPQWLYSLDWFGGTTSPELTTPYLSEMLFSQILLDLWDGPNNYTAVGNTTWGTGDTDDEIIEMSLTEIMRPFVENPGEPDDLLDYFGLLLTGDCEFDGQLQDMFYFNFSNTSQPAENICVLNTDEIAANLPLTWQVPDFNNQGDYLGVCRRTLNNRSNSPIPLSIYRLKLPFQ